MKKLICWLFGHKDAFKFKDPLMAMTNDKTKITYKFSVCSRCKSLYCIGEEKNWISNYYKKSKNDSLIST